MLFAAGLITGEALMGIVIAIPIVATGRADVLALPALRCSSAAGSASSSSVRWRGSCTRGDGAQRERER